MNLDNLRNSLSSMSSDLRSRKFLAVVGLLVVLVVAIPVLLARSGKASAVPALPPAPTVTTPASAVALVTPHRAASNSFRTGRRHNPFLADTSTTPASTTTTSDAVSNSSGGNGATAATQSSPASSGTAAATSTPNTTVASSAPNPAAASTQPTVTPTTPASTVTVVKTVTQTTPTPVSPVLKTVTKTPPFSDYEARLTLRETGSSARATQFRNLSRYQLLPADNGAFASFLGIRRDKKTAVFVLGSDVTATGEGRCAPSTQNCSFLMLEPGQSVTLHAPDWAGSKSYALKYTGVGVVTSSASIVQLDDSGRDVIEAARKNIASLRKLSYDRHTGLLHIALGTSVPVSS